MNAVCEMRPVKKRSKTCVKTDRLINKVKDTIDRYSMLKKGDNVLVAVSGGPDSVCALEVLNAIKDEYSLSLHVAHLNHKFRKEAEEQAETFLMRLIRGSGASCLSAIPPVRGRIIRPLIEITKSEALGFLKENNIRYVKDPTNIRPLYLRNKIRLELLPLLVKKYNPNIADTLCREADILREDESFLNGIADAIFKEMVTVQEKDSITLNYLRFNGIHPAIKKRVGRRAVSELTGGLKKISYQHIISAIDAIKNTGKGVDLPDDIRIERDYNSLYVRVVKAESARIQEAVHIEAPGTTGVPYFNIKIEAIINKMAVVSEKADTGLFDLDKISLPLFVRGRKEGDYFYPAGMKGRKKLKEFLIDHKISRVERR